MRGWASVMLMVAALTGCTISTPQSITFPVSCAGMTTGPVGAAANSVVPARVLHTASATLVLVPVCLSGQGPYPFVLDTGATRSVVDRRLAELLQLPLIGTTTPATGVGCTTPAQPVQVESWSVGAVPLRAQPLSSLPMVGSTGGPGIAGLLGSDVWSRFGQFTLDYQAGQLMLPGSEQATVPTSAPASAQDPARRVPMTVIHRGAGTLATVPVTLDGHGPMSFVLDTGASSSVVDRQVAQGLSLPPVGRAQRVAGVSCTASTQRVHLDSWLVGTVSLPAQNLDGIALPPGLTGLLGSDVLYRFGSVTVDYTAGSLTLGG